MRYYLKNGILIKTRSAMREDQLAKIDGIKQRRQLFKGQYLYRGLIQYTTYNGVEKYKFRTIIKRQSKLVGRPRTHRVERINQMTRGESKQFRELFGLIRANRAQHRADIK